MERKTIQVVILVVIVVLGVLAYQYLSLKTTYDKLSVDFAALTEEHKNLQVSYLFLQGNYTSLSNKYVALNESHNQALIRIADLESQVSNLQSQLSSVQNELKALQVSYSSLQANYTALNREYSDALSTISNLQSQLETVRTQYNTLQSQYLILQSQQSILQARYDSLQAQNNILQTTYNTLKSQCNNLQSQYTALQTQHNSLKAQYDTLQAQYNALLTKSYRDFNDLIELSNWLAADPVSQHPYSASYDCDDFAFDLMVDAFKSGYRMSAVCVYLTDTLSYTVISGSTYYLVPITFAAQPIIGEDYYGFGNHFVNLAYVKTVGWVVIEPQNDAVYLVGRYEL